MKNFIISILLLCGFCGASYYEHNYIREECQVIQVNDGIATIKDICGFYWDVETDGLKVGNIVNLKMNDNCTSSYIYDDIVKDVVLIRE